MESVFRLKNLQLNNPFLLAPLAGFTDKSMRTLCAEQGASLTYTEMVSCKGLRYGDRKTGQLLEIGEDEGPVGFQLFGDDPEILEWAAGMLAAGDGAGPVTLDLNCGCPVPKIVKNGEGSALMKRLDVLHDCVEAMVKGTEAAARTGGDRRPIPVTAKIRMGFAKGENVAVEAARAVEAAGAAAVTVHGRTREQYYEGAADWDVIAEVKKAVNIPVIGNGDVRNGGDAIRMMRETGCDGVMIARGALGNPWIFAEALALWRNDFFGEPTVNERLDMLLRHFDMVCRDKGERIAVREIRKYVGWYTKGMRGAAAVRREINTTDDPARYREIIDSLR